MHRQFVILGLICLGLCSCQRIVCTPKPVIAIADKSDLSLAGVWARYKRPVVDDVAGDETIEVSGPDGAGVYQATTKVSTSDTDFRTTFVASQLPEKFPDGFTCVLLQVDLSRLADKPCNCYAYAVVKDEWLFLRRIESKKLTDVIERENLQTVVTHAGFSTEVSADPKELLRLLQSHVKEITADAGVYRRVKPPAP